MKNWFIETDTKSYTLEADKIIVTDNGDLIATVNGEAVVILANGTWNTVELVTKTGDSMYLTEVRHAG